MNNIIKLLKGIAIGIANVIPGFSGGTMAVMLNIYDEFVSAFADFLNHPIKVIKKSWAIFLGVLIGVFLSLFSIVKLLEIALVPTILLFIGLILGSLPSSYKSMKLKPFKFSYALIFILTFSLIVTLPLLSSKSVDNIDINFLNLMIIFIMGIVSSSAMVLPGVSGSMILMIFGYYAFILGNIKDFILGFIHMEFSNLLNPFLVLLMFGLGIILGVIVISKIIRLFYTKHENLFNIGVFSLLLASPIAIFIASNSEYDSLMIKSEWYMYLIGAVTLTCGFLLSYYGEKMTKKIKKEEQVNEIS